MIKTARVIAGIGGLLGHDGNAAVLVDGQLIASSQEERYTRKKHDAAFPRNSLLDCLNMAGLSPADVSLCVFAEKPFASLVFDHTRRVTGPLTWWLSRFIGAGRFEYSRNARRMLPGAQFHYAWHHLSHAAAAFATSPFERAAFLCIDGKGEDVSATVGTADARGVEISHELAYENGLGLLYSLVTFFLGYTSFGSEYKIMGLAPYGEPVYIDKLRTFTRSDANGALRLNQPLTFAWPDLQRGAEMLGQHLGFAPRDKSEPLGDEHVNLAASIQAVFEEEIVKMAAFAGRMTGAKNLLFCGGCAQNCVVAGKLRRLGLFEGLFNSPVGGDMGSGMGAALLGHHLLTGVLPKVDPHGFLLGSGPGEVPDDAIRFQIPYTGSIHEASARLLAEGKILGWVRGRMELGARALGARSILADPRVPGMQSLLNHKVKFRESFRPFAPAVLGEDCGQWFDTSEPSDFMQYTAYILPEYRYPMPRELTGLRERLDYRRCEVPSIIHVDYSARLQTVQRDVHPDFHALISSFRNLTGIPFIINTSFNVSGQPIVRTAAEAWQCFRHTDMDYLVVNDMICRNPGDRTREEKLAWLRQYEKYS